MLKTYPLKLLGPIPNNSMGRRIKRATHAYNNMCSDYEIFLEENLFKLRRVMESDGVQFESKGGEIEDWDSKIADIRDLVGAVDFESRFTWLGDKFTSLECKKIVSDFLDNNLTLIRDRINHYIEDFIDESNEREIGEIESNLNGRLLANFSGALIPDSLNKILKNGRKFTPFFSPNPNLNKKVFFDDLCNVLSGLVRGFNGLSIKPETLVKDVTHALTHPDIDEVISKVLEMTLDESINNNFSTAENTYIPRNTRLENLREWVHIVKNEIYGSGLALLESDKNLGFSVLTIEQVLKLYTDINKVQGYSKVNISEIEYLELVHKLKKINCPVIPSQLKWMITKEMELNFINTEGSIAILRLLVKSGKIDTPSVKSFPKLTARTVKSGVTDPINGVSDILRVVSQHIILGLKRLLKEEYGVSFTVVGSSDAYSQMQNVKEQFNLTDAVNLNSDITEMYPNTVFSIVKQATLEAGRLLRIHKDIIDFMINAIFVVMKCNFVRQPTGVYHMDGPDPALSIGDPAAAEISDYTLMISEISMIRALRVAKLSHHLLLYLRFRDDIDAKIGGTLSEILEIIRIIFAHFPPCYHLKSNISVVGSKFLDIKRVVNLGHKEWLLGLRKRNNSYDITRFHSNTWKAAKWSAMTTYAYRMLRATNSHKDFIHQFRIYKMVLKARGFPNDMFENRVRMIRKREAIRKRIGREASIEEKLNKLSIGSKKFIKPVTYDEASKNHSRVANFLKSAGINKSYRNAGFRPSKKVLPIIFTKKKFINGVQEFLGLPLTDFKINKVKAKKMNK